MARAGRRLIMGVVAALLLSACAGVVTRPDPEADLDTRAVMLLDHGRHSSLVLTRADQSMVRYLYGDWRWYAERDTGFLRAFPTLFAPTRSALGRRQLAAPATEASLRRQIPVYIQAVHGFAVASERIDRLDRRLDEHFADHIEKSLFNDYYDLEFVPGPRPYTLFDNSNHVVADWLEELGVDVRGSPIFGHWRVENDSR
ncbi:MAG: hypothetical protein EA419_03940 [Wenzhouxiangella sp.]|nr:MAG: hypothetical protein EA419_03940 [Wenzhouxiangella sp.]